jgi:hypothetical protein
VDWAQVVAVVSALGLLTGGQAYWIGRALDRVEARMDRVETRLARIESAIRDLGERVARPEPATATPPRRS